MKQYGERNWWPAETRFEIIVGAILTQNTSWHNVEKAIRNLKDLDLLEPGSIVRISLKKLEKAVFPTGFYRQKAKRLKNFSSYLVKNYEGDLDKLFSNEICELRDELLNLNGIGPETADSILLYAGEVPVFVIDAYTRRLCKRLGITNAESYEELQNFFMEKVPGNVQMYNEFHALIVEFCKNICKSKPECSICFLKKNCNYGMLGHC
jgi:endonuclease-3 related protein